MNQNILTINFDSFIFKDQWQKRGKPMKKNECFISVFNLSCAKLITPSMRKGTMETSINMTSHSKGWYIVAANEKGKRRNRMVAVY